ncbi:DUF4890 domain-containing protein [Arundinibacter roseus]|uniref:DUF4890 domain-containing protein n=1 Tax=Arundinibacter roseus TaxID=2070510 RepID=A0A4R4KBB3_9BACT|nr:DUF4890 domain-containing protein [Arundinibacter roseus]TDB65070.1 DUF4890 domain-containing protein [Arundinibacter roseus]
MKKGILLVALMALLTTANAQRGTSNATPEERAKRQTERMTEQLALTAGQQEQVYTLNMAQATKMQELRASPDREKMREAQEKFSAAISEILTPEQRVEYKKREEEMRNNRPQNGQGGGGRSRGPQ